MGYVIYVDGCLLEGAGAFETEDDAMDWLTDNADNTDGSDYEIVEFE